MTDSHPKEVRGKEPAKCWCGAQLVADQCGIHGRHWGNKMAWEWHTTDHEARKVGIRERLETRNDQLLTPRYQLLAKDEFIAHAPEDMQYVLDALEKAESDHEMLKQGYMDSNQYLVKRLKEENTDKARLREALEKIKKALIYLKSLELPMEFGIENVLEKIKEIIVNALAPQPTSQPDEDGWLNEQIPVEGEVLSETTENDE